MAGKNKRTGQRGSNKRSPTRTKPPMQQRKERLEKRTRTGQRSSTKRSPTRDGKGRFR